jgi:hypothetical protein
VRWLVGSIDICIVLAFGMDGLWLEIPTDYGMMCLWTGRSD